MMSGTAVGILTTGSYLPEEEVSNEEIARKVGVAAEWIERKTQIRSRRYAAADEATSDLAAKAALDALGRADISIDEIDYIIVATSTGDSPQPPTAYLVQDLLKAYKAACFDINVACSGFIYGLALAQSLVALHPDRYVLVIAADLYSRILDFSDRRTAVLLGDGAGAAVVGAVKEPQGIIDAELRSRGDAGHLIRVDAGGSRHPTSHDTVSAGGHLFRMDGRGVRDFVMENVPLLLKDFVTCSGFSLDDVQHFIPHQANGVLLTELIERAGLSGACTSRTLERYGNVGGASVPIALAAAHHRGVIKDNDLVLLAAFGGGMSIGACLLRWSTSPARRA
jgi:acetoacetyl-CoA synthase